MREEPCDLIIQAPWLLPLIGEKSGEKSGEKTAETEEDNPVIENAAIAITDGRIVAAAEAAEVRARYRATENIDLASHILLPGLVNAHGHTAMSLFRGHAENSTLQTWLTEQIWPLEARWVDEQFVRDGVRLAMAEMIRAGITCFSDMYFFPEATAAEAKRAGVRAQIAFPVIEFPNAWSASSEEGFHKGLGLYDEYRNDPHIQIAFGPHSVYTITSSDLEKILMYSEELDAGIQIHLHENAAESADNLKQFGCSGVEHLHQHGLLSPRLQAVHMTQLAPREIDLLAESNASVVHCPTSNAKLASGYCPISRLLNASVNVSLGTDGAASNNALCILSEARVASLLAKLNDDDATSLSAARALEMATLGGAKTLGLEHEIGSIEPGKAADLIAIDGNAAKLTPMYDPITQVVHTPSASQVSHVWVDGRLLLDDGRLTSLDEPAILNEARRWQNKILG